MTGIRWSEEKNERIKEERHVSFERIAEIISNERYLAVLHHPDRENQRLFVIEMDGYVWAVPYVIEDDGQTIFLKTAFPTRKFNRIYGAGRSE
ncbi:toxin [Salinispira pacifica]